MTRPGHLLQCLRHTTSQLTTWTAIIAEKSCNSWNRLWCTRFRQRGSLSVTFLKKDEWLGLIKLWCHKGRKFSSVCPEKNCLPTISVQFSITRSQLRHQNLSITHKWYWQPIENECKLENQCHLRCLIEPAILSPQTRCMDHWESLLQDQIYIMRCTKLDIYKVPSAL